MPALPAEPLNTSSHARTPRQKEADENRLLASQLPHSPNDPPMIPTHGFAEADRGLLSGGTTTSTARFDDVYHNIENSQRKSISQQAQGSRRTDVVIVEEEPGMATSPRSVIPPHQFSKNHPHAVSPPEDIKVVDEEPAKSTIPITVDAMESDAPTGTGGTKDFDPLTPSRDRTIIQEEPGAATIPESTVPPHHLEAHDHPHAVDKPWHGLKVVDEEPAKATVPVDFDAMRKTHEKNPGAEGKLSKFIGDASPGGSEGLVIPLPDIGDEPVEGMAAPAQANEATKKKGEEQVGGLTAATKEKEEEQVGGLTAAIKHVVASVVDSAVADVLREE